MIIKYEDFLEHYGVKGMKWGVRRYQNADGTLTAEGKRRIHAANVYKNVHKTSKDVQDIVDTMSDKERKLLGVNGSRQYMKEEEIQYVAKRFITKYQDVPVAFLDVYYKGDGVGEIAIGSRSGSEYRGKGYASTLVQKAKTWMETPEAKEIFELGILEWDADSKNAPSIAIAKKHGFEKTSSSNGRWTGRYIRK